MKTHVRIRARLPPLPLFAFVASADPGLTAASTPNDAARILAGMPPSQNSPLAASRKMAAGSATPSSSTPHGTSSTSGSSPRYAPGSPSNMPAPQPVMFYMFSGPDFLYADAFFPKASTYVLSGLEPIGDGAGAERYVRAASLSGELRHLQSSLNSACSSQLLHHQGYAEAASRRQGARHACQCCICFWRAPARPSRKSASSMSTWRAMRRHPTARSSEGHDEGREDRLFRR